MRSAWSKAVGHRRDVLRLLCDVVVSGQSALGRKGTAFLLL